MDLQVHIEPHGSEWYMPGDDVKGWVRCRSECFHQGTAFSVLSVHTSLAGLSNLQTNLFLIVR